MGLNRADLRLALTAGLANGFGVISGLPFALYAPLAVLAVCTGTYGSSRSLGRQRLLGSLLGMGVLLLAYEGLRGVPFPLAIAVALGSMRLLGGLLGLQVGYKVGGIVVVMGWLVHGSQLSSWIPLRLFWTTAGILLAVASLRLLWPARALPAVYAGLRSLLAELGDRLEGVAATLDGPGPHPGRPGTPTTAGPLPLEHPWDIGPGRSQLQTLRRQLPAAFSELGGDPSHHPQAQLLKGLCESCSLLLSALGGLGRPIPPAGDPAELTALQRAEAELLAALAGRLTLWARQLTLEEAHPVPPPPAAGWRPPQRWLALQQELQAVRLEQHDLQRLRRHASRLALCSLALQAVERGERRWRTLQHHHLDRPGSP